MCVCGARAACAARAAPHETTRSRPRQSLASGGREAARGREHRALREPRRHRCCILPLQLRSRWSRARHAAPSRPFKPPPPPPSNPLVWGAGWYARRQDRARTPAVAPPAPYLAKFRDGREIIRRRGASVFQRSATRETRARHALRAAAAPRRLCRRPRRVRVRARPRARGAETPANSCLRDG